MPGVFGAPLYGPVYAGIGVPAVMIVGAAEVSLTVIDDTRPKLMPSVGSPLEVRSVGPGAYARIPELADNGITRDDYLDALLTFNGRAWSVRSYELMGSPNGEDQGEVRFLLKDSNLLLIVMDGKTVPEDASVGDTVGVLSVVGATGTPVYTLTGDGFGHFVLAGANVNVAAPLDFETTASYNISVEVTGVTPPVPMAVFPITVTDVAGG